MSTMNRANSWNSNSSEEVPENGKDGIQAMSGDGLASLAGRFDTALGVVSISGDELANILSIARSALPLANLFGGDGNDVLTGGTGGDLLFAHASL